MEPARGAGAEDERKEARPRDPGRRRFLKGAVVGTGAVGLSAALPSAAARASSPDDLAEQHAGDASMLIDLTRCIGCGSCVTACKLQHHLEWRSDQPALGPNAALASENWSVVRTAGETPSGQMRYVKTNCLHCLEPACVSACFVRALTKTDAGPVVYDGDRCVGCRYCLLACPFGVPTFEWDATFGRVSKCNFCVARTSAGVPSACAAACPSGAITFGRRRDMLALAHARIDSDPQTYVPRVYGEEEAGGTSVLYVSDVSFEALGFATEVPTKPLPDYTWEISRLLPPIAAGLAATLIVLYGRRKRLLESIRAFPGEVGL
jgi:formate dehydrogenase iron-sulfur subunit